MTAIVKEINCLLERRSANPDSYLDVVRKDAATKVVTTSSDTTLTNGVSTSEKQLSNGTSPQVSIVEGSGVAEEPKASVEVLDDVPQVSESSDPSHSPSDENDCKSMEDEMKDDSINDPVIENFTTPLSPLSIDPPSEQSSILSSPSSPMKSPMKSPINCPSSPNFRITKISPPSSPAPSSVTPPASSFTKSPLTSPAPHTHNDGNNNDTATLDAPRNLESLIYNPDIYFTDLSRECLPLYIENLELLRLEKMSKGS